MRKEKIFEVTGSFAEKGQRKKFAKRVRAFNERFAAEKILSLFGSKHAVKRRNISINEIKEVKADGEKK